MQNSALLKSATFVALFYIHFAKAQNKYSYFTRIECPQSPSKYVKEYGCSLIPRNDSVLQLNANFMPRYDIHNITLSFKFSIERNGKYLDYFIMESMDMCEALCQLQGNLLLRMIHEGLRSSSNFPLECPLKKDFLYVVKNFTSDTFTIPPYLPEMNWMFYSNFSAYGKYGVVFNTYGKVVKVPKKYKRQRKN